MPERLGIRTSMRTTSGISSCGLLDGLVAVGGLADELDVGFLRRAPSGGRGGTARGRRRRSRAGACRAARSSPPVLLRLVVRHCPRPLAGSDSVPAGAIRRPGRRLRILVDCTPGHACFGVPVMVPELALEPVDDLDRARDSTSGPSRVRRGTSSSGCSRPPRGASCRAPPVTSPGDDLDLARGPPGDSMRCEPAELVVARFVGSGRSTGGRGP